MNRDTKLDFFIVGEPKSGTTALATFMSQHPEIALSVPKEPNYFANDHVKDSDRFHGRQVYYPIRSFDDYLKVFYHAQPGKQLLGEASTGYLYSTEAASNIYKHNPKAKIIIMLREPVAFLHSLHMQYVNEAGENEPDFAKALALEPARREDWSLISNKCRCPTFLYYSERIKYAEQVKRFSKLFQPEQILVLTHEEFRADNRATYLQVLRFLGVDESIFPEFRTIHTSKQPRLKRLNQTLNSPTMKKFLREVIGERAYIVMYQKARKILLKEQPRQPIEQQLADKLRRQAHPEVENISRLLNRDFAKLWGYR